jgi:hypothetical protein
MNPNIEGQLLQAGVLSSDVRRRLDGPGKSFVITDNDLIYSDGLGLQRAPLNMVSKVVVDRSGALTVNSPSGPLIETSVRGFEVAQLRTFFDDAKSAIARAKAGPGPTSTAVSATDTVAGVPPMAELDPIPVPAPEPVVVPAPEERPRDPWAYSPPADPEPVSVSPTLTQQLDAPPVVEPAPVAQAVPTATAAPQPASVMAPVATPLPVEDTLRPRPRQDDLAWQRPAPAATTPAVEVVGNPGMRSLAQWLTVVAGLALVLGLAGAVLYAQRASSVFDWLTVAAWVVGGVFALLLGLAVSAVLGAFASAGEVG